MAVRNTEEQPVIVETIKTFLFGYNGYADPEALPPQMWAQASNVYSGQHGEIRRCRFANLVVGDVTTGFAAQTARFTGLFPFKDPSQHIVIGDINNKIFSFNSASSYAATERVHPFYASGASAMGGNWSRWALLNMLFEMNGTIKMRGRGANLTTIEGWGMDAPDASAAITKNAPSAIAAPASSGATRSNGVSTITTTAAHRVLVGSWVTIAEVSDSSFNGTFQVVSVPTSTTFTYSQSGLADVASGTAGNGTVGRLDKTVGRSYRFSWENSNIGDISAPSPATAYQAYANQDALVDCIQPGTVATTLGSPTVTGTGTAFTSAWVGRKLWIEGLSDRFYVTAVASATSLTLSSNATATVSGKKHQIYDPQTTHIRLYATADGGAVYFRTLRNTFDPSQTTLAASGLEFFDGAATEPPSNPFQTETAQFFNVPPPIGRYLQEYQSRLIVFGVDSTPQTFYYSNIEFTVFGSAPSNFAPLNQITLPIGDAAIGAMGALPTGLIIWSDRQDMFKLTGLLQDNSAADDFTLGSTIQRLPYDLGCSSPWTPTLTPLGLFWLTSDREVRLFNDQYAPRNVGRAVQDILTSINPARLKYAKMTYYHVREKSWLVLAVATGASTFNNKLLVLDLDLLAANGDRMSYLFDEASNSPSWYVFDLTAEGLAASWDGNLQQHLITGDTDKIVEGDYDGVSFKQGAELSVTANVTLHAWGNKNPESIKRMKWCRFTTNRTPSQMVTDGWSFQLQGIDDDVYTFGSPLTLGLVPGVNSVQKTGEPARAFEYSTSLFRFDSVNFMQGRRIRVNVTFPTGADAFAFRSVQLAARAFKPR